MEGPEEGDGEGEGESSSWDGRPSPPSGRWQPNKARSMTPPRALPTWRASPHLKSGALVTDVGSVKRGIVARADRLGISNRFAGSHPLAGTHRHGFEAARVDLFRGAVVYVTPCSGPGGGDAAREIAHFWEDVLGAEPVVLDAARHDAQLAATSHVPQVVASLLGDFLAQHAPPGSTFGTGAADTTRLAASDPALWTEILLMNRDELLPALRALEESLGTVEHALEVGDATALTAWLLRCDALAASSGRPATRASRIACSCWLRWPAGRAS